MGRVLPSTSPPQHFEKEMDAILDSVQDGLYITDGDGLTLRVNRAFEELSGLDARRLLGRSVQDLVSQGVYDRSVTLDVLRHGRQMSLREILPNGQEALLTGTPVRDEKGHIIRVVTTLHNLRALQELEAHLAQSEGKQQRYKQELLRLKRSHQISPAVVCSPRMQELFLLANRVAQVDSTVLISGESGVGKELIARAIHQEGPRSTGPLVTANCGAIPETLLESELFGYEEGAFSGASRGGKCGLFEAAEGGTLFLDEVGELSLNLQVKILRALQEREILRVGGLHPRKVHVRIIAATNRNLRTMIKKNTFRQDLYYRLAVVPMHVPPLRERREEILPLTRHFLDVYNRRFDAKTSLDDASLRCLEDYHWPGNVRELENTVERLVVLVPHRPVTPSDLPEMVRTPSLPEESPVPFMPLEQGVEWVERQLLSEALSRYQSTRRMATALEVSQSTVVRKMERYGLS